MSLLLSRGEGVINADMAMKLLMNRVEANVTNYELDKQVKPAMASYVI